jgi:hypothetical protein
MVRQPAVLDLGFHGNDVAFLCVQCCLGCADIPYTFMLPQIDFIPCRFSSWNAQGCDSTLLRTYAPGPERGTMLYLDLVLIFQGAAAVKQLPISVHSRL